MLERILKDRIVAELNTRNWFSPAQHGFRTGRSTVSNLIEFYDKATEEMDQGHPVDILFFDLAKAFDTVPHSKLISKLKVLNLNKKIIDWILNYLSKRKQRVTIRGVQSDWLEWCSTGIRYWSIAILDIYK